MHQALAAILSNLAKQYNPSDPDSFSGRAALNRTKNSKISLPGSDTAEKRALEREVNSLAARIAYLEDKATGSQSLLPITPSEPESSPFSTVTSTPSTPIKSSSAASTRSRSGSYVNQLLSKKESTNGEQGPHQLTEEQLSTIRQHVEQQAGQIQAQSAYIDNINVKLEQQQHATKEALTGIETSLNEVEVMKLSLIHI